LFHRSGASIPFVVATGLHAASLANCRESLATPEAPPQETLAPLAIHSDRELTRGRAANRHNASDARTDRYSSGGP